MQDRQFETLHQLLVEVQNDVVLSAADRTEAALRQLERQATLDTIAQVISHVTPTAALNQVDSFAHRG